MRPKLSEPCFDGGYRLPRELPNPPKKFEIELLVAARPHVRAGPFSIGDRTLDRPERAKHTREIEEHYRVRRGEPDLHGAAEIPVDDPFVAFDEFLDSALPFRFGRFRPAGPPEFSVEVDDGQAGDLAQASSECR